jgi:hypothetical protein
MSEKTGTDLCGFRLGMPEAVMRAILFRAVGFGFGSLLLAAGAASPGQWAEYLSDRRDRIADSHQDWGKLGFDVAAYTSGQTPQPIMIRAKQYAKGLGACPGEIVVLLEGDYLRFEADVGVQPLGSHLGTVVFQVYVDDQKRFDSGVMRARDEAKPVRISLEGANELRLVATDAGDGINCDMANWADARLVRATSPAACPKPPRPRVDIAQFARVATWEADRADGPRCTAGSRVNEFPADELFLESDLPQAADGTYAVPLGRSGRGCIGLQWLQRRRLVETSLEFAGDVPPTDGVQLQCWVPDVGQGSPGGSPWQGAWKPLPGVLVQAGNSWVHRIHGWDNLDGTWKIRWIIPPLPEPIRVRRLRAYTVTAWNDLQVLLQLEKPRAGHRGEVEIYNGELIEPAQSTSPTRCAWDLGKPLTLAVRHSSPRRSRLDRTVIRLRLPDAEFGVSIDSLLAEKCVYVPSAGLFATIGPKLEQYKQQIAGRKTILEQVRQKPDQTLRGALAAAHRPVQDLGPTMISLACDNAKFCVLRNGMILFSPEAELIDRAVAYPCAVVPRFESFEIAHRTHLGEGTPASAAVQKEVTRFLEDDWMPIPVTRVELNGVVYTQRTFVAPMDEQCLPQGAPWLYRRSACVAQYAIENTRAQPASVSLDLAFLADAEAKRTANVSSVPDGVVARTKDRLLAHADMSACQPLRSEIKDGRLVVSGVLSPKGRARFQVCIPAWPLKPEAHAALRGAESRLSATKEYWRRLLASGMQIEIPDPLLKNLILASQVHCLITARHEAGGLRIAPWTGADRYGPLEGDSQYPVIGMDLMGHSEYARRCHDFYIRRYNPQGFLNFTGYTVMGTGWHLWTLAQHYELTRDKAWLKQSAPEVARVCQWVKRQHEKTKRLDARGQKMPEHGLMPPGVEADWNAFAYYFCLNGYFHAGLHGAARALADIGHPGAEELLAAAEDLREDILRAYHRTQSQMAVNPLGNGAWAPGYPSQVHCPSPTAEFFPGEDSNRTWCYDVEEGAPHLVVQGVLDPRSDEVAWMMEHLESVQFLADGWFDYPHCENVKDPFGLGGFSKVQPYLTRLPQMYALRDDIKPFLRAYFNSAGSLLNLENLSFWEHFNATASWTNAEGIGHFLEQTRWMLVMERGDELWLAPFISNRWLASGREVSVRNAPTRFGKVGYQIKSHIERGYVEATISPPDRNPPARIAIRLRHPEGKPIQSVTLDGASHHGFDPGRDCVYVEQGRGPTVVRAKY